MAKTGDVFPVTIAGLQRDLPIFEVQPGVRIAVLNILGDTELVNAAGRALAPKILAVHADTLVTAEAKSIPFAHALSTETGLPYVVLRKSYKPYMGETIQSETLSITTGKPQTLFLDEKDRRFIEGRRVVMVDDVISTGSTLEGMRVILQKANVGEIVAEAAILTEGDFEKWRNILALGHLPVWVDD
jgi:adenine phosphoribosyltransferase